MVFSFIEPAMTSFHNAGSMGEVFVWKWLGVSPGIVIFAASLMAVGAFTVGTIVERKKGTVVTPD